MLFILFSTLMFSSMEIALKFAGGAFNPIQLNLIRFYVGGLILLPLATHSNAQSHIRITLRDWGLFALTGFICVIVSMTLYQLAIASDQPQRWPYYLAAIQCLHSSFRTYYCTNILVGLT